MTTKNTSQSLVVDLNKKDYEGYKLIEKTDADVIKMLHEVSMMVYEEIKNDYIPVNHPEMPSYNVLNENEPLSEVDNGKLLNWAKKKLNIIDQITSNSGTIKKLKGKISFFSGDNRSSRLEGNDRDNIYNVIMTTMREINTIYLKHLQNHAEYNKHKDKKIYLYSGMETIPLYEEDKQIITLSDGIDTTLMTSQFYVESNDYKYLQFEVPLNSPYIIPVLDIINQKLTDIDEPGFMSEEEFYIIADGLFKTTVLKQQKTFYIYDKLISYDEPKYSVWDSDIAETIFDIMRNFGGKDTPDSKIFKSFLLKQHELGLLIEREDIFYYIYTSLFNAMNILMNYTSGLIKKYFKTLFIKATIFNFGDYRELDATEDQIQEVKNFIKCMKHMLRYFDSLYSHVIVLPQPKGMEQLDAEDKFEDEAIKIVKVFQTTPFKQAAKNYDAPFILVHKYTPDLYTIKLDHNSGASKGGGIPKRMSKMFKRISKKKIRSHHRKMKGGHKRYSRRH